MEKSENAVKDKPVLLHWAPESVSSLKVNEKSKRANLFGHRNPYHRLPVPKKNHER
jgi:hypothetical protein